MKNEFIVMNENGSVNEEGMKEVVEFIRLHGVQHHYHVAIQNGVLEIGGVHVKTLEDRDAFLNKHENDVVLDDDGKVWRIKTGESDRWGIPVFAAESRENLPYETCVELSLCKGSKEHDLARSVGLI